MADAAVEKNGTSVVEKVAVEVDGGANKKDAVTVDEAVNGVEAVDGKENGAAPADESVSTAKASLIAADADEATDEAAEPAVSEENGKKATDEADANGAEEEDDDEEDASPAEAVKRKAAEPEKKSEDSVGVATPEKKAKLDEPATKDEVQNGSEASEVAA